MDVKINIDVDKILRGRGIGSANGFRVLLANEIARRSDPYVPMQQGTLKNTVQIAADGSTITYNQPYARMQWYGKVMRDENGRAWYGKAPKHATDQDMNYHGSPMRGPKWVDRMLLDHKQEILSDMAKAAGGKPK